MFMFGGGRSMGGGAGAGGGMLRTVGRTVTRAGVTNLQEPISSSNSSTTSPASPTANSRPSHNRNNNNNKNHLSLSAAAAALSTPFCSHNIPVSAGSGVVPSWPAFGSSSCCDEYEWVSVDGFQDEKSHGYFVDDEKSNGYFVDDFVLGPVPSLDEVHTAVSALQQVFEPASHSQLVRDKFASNSNKDVDLDWVEPTLHPNNTRMLQPYVSDRVYDAFHLLETEPSIQRMVISLSSDRAVWNAVLNNEVVRELKESFYSAENNGSESSNESSDYSNPAINFIMWIFDNTKLKVMEVMEKITNVVNELFKPPADEKAETEAATGGKTDPFEEKLRTSFFLSIVVLLVVVVTRASRT